MPKGDSMSRFTSRRPEKPERSRRGAYVHRTFVPETAVKKNGELCCTKHEIGSNGCYTSSALADTLRLPPRLAVEGLQWNLKVAAPAGDGRGAQDGNECCLGRLVPTPANRSHYSRTLLGVEYIDHVPFPLNQLRYRPWIGAM
jgi:hypothetical protein